MFEPLYDVTENASLNFVGYMTDTARYDFAIVYTDHFFGKPLVVCMQTGRSAPLCSEDLSHLDYLQKLYNLSGQSDAKELASFLEQHIHALGYKDEI